MRTIIVGDIHGCARTFSAILRSVRLDPAQDQLILLGDLYDRGPESWEVWQNVQELAAAMGERFILLQGNHEAYWLTERPSLSARFLHERVGKKATEISFRKHDTEVDKSVPWLREHCVMYYREERFQCVHAGVMVEPLEDNDTFTLIHDHEVVLQNIYSGRLTVTGHIALEEPTWFAGDERTVLPLAPDMPHDLPGNGVICIDTGCGKGGSLTAMIVEGEQFRLIQIPQLEMA